MNRLRHLRSRSARLITRTWRRLPVSAAVRRRLTGRLLWRGPTQVPVDRILLGGQNDLSAGEYAARTGDLLWASRLVADGPHTELLRQAELGQLNDRDILESGYGEMARTCIQASGHYFGAVDDASVVQQVRERLGGARGATRPAQSALGTPVLLAPVRGSDCYQVVDGHHRVAAQIVRGHDLVEARVRRVSVTTPLQDLLNQMSWIGGKRELYQPVEAPELQLNWTTVRRCKDRLDLMEKLLAELGVVPNGSTYLDVASAYGWFVAEMSQMGFTSTGVERDPLAVDLGSASYGIRPDQVVTDDAEEFLRATPRTWDVVSCFSLLHHFALGRASVDAVDLLRLLDRVTGRVLFIDTGQAHEDWFHDSLREWDTAYVADFLERFGTFDRVVDLGPDQDAVAPYSGNYGRHLFACIRT